MALIDDLRAEILGALDGKIAEAEGALAELRRLRAGAISRFVAVHAPTTRADRIAAALRMRGRPASVSYLIDALRDMGDGREARRNQVYNWVYTTLVRARTADCSGPRFAPVAPLTWWFAEGAEA